MEKYVPFVFLINILLIIADAALGYFVAPLMVRRVEGEAVWSAGSVRRLLSIVVAFYMFFNCLAYFGGNSLLLLIVTGVVLFDIVFQLVVRRKLRSGP